MINQGTGAGGRNTNVAGLKFEEKVSIVRLLFLQKGYELIPKEYALKGKVNSRWDILFNHQNIGEIFRQFGLERFLREHEIEMLEIISKGFKPDDAIYLIEKNFVHIIEDKTQNGSGSVDEKLQVAPFKIQQYNKLFAKLNRTVKFTFVLDKEWFGNKKYSDTLEYIRSIDDCDYIFDTELEPFPFKKFDLPEFEENK